MLFSLEALEAREGDSLLLHWGDVDAPNLILIDGGPRGVYKRTLKPRLEELREAQDDPNAALRIVQLMISHIDADHIAGILDLTDDLIREDDRGNAQPYRIVTLWHNSFDDMVGKQGSDVLGAAAGAASAAAASTDGGELAGLGLSHQGTLVLAGVNQGRNLRKNAERLSLNVNSPFGEMVEAPADGRAVKEFDDGLKFTVVAPDAGELEDLRQKWIADLPAILAKEKARLEAAAYLDKSAANLSSIVVVAEAAGKTMLLTGDARGDGVLKGLARAGFLDPDDDTSRFTFDLLKMPHHGSIHNVDRDFFERLPARHYVFSANGRHHNPDLETLEMLTDIRRDDDFVVWMTNHTDWADEHFRKDREAGRNYRVVHRDEGALSVVVDLGDEELDR